MESNFSKEDIAKFMAFIIRKRAEESAKESSATYVESPKPEVKATAFQTDGDDDVEISLDDKNDFLLEERIRSLMSRSKFYEAVSLSEVLESVDEMDVGLKLLIAECYIHLGRETKAEKTIREIEKILMELPICYVDDVLALAEDFRQSAHHIRALLLLRIASDIFYNNSSLSPDDKIDRIFRCVNKTDDVTDEMVEPPAASEDAQNILAIQQALVENGDASIDASKILANKNKSSKISSRTLALAWDYGVEVMIKMLDKINSIEDADPGIKSLRLASSANRISSHYSTNQYLKAVEKLTYGIDLIEKEFGKNANQYSLYPKMLKNLGAVLHNAEKYKEAEPFSVRALEAVEYVLDYESEEKKQEAIKEARESVRITRSHMKLA